MIVIHWICLPMSHTVFIHGFATGITFSFFRPIRGNDAGFGIFSENIRQGDGRVFRWDIKERATLFQTLNPFYTAHVYAREHSRILNKEWQNTLHNFLKNEQPTTIVCHSLGCRFLLETANAHGLPNSVRHVIFIQADIPKVTELTHQDLRQRIQRNELTFWNLYCPWDPSLFFSSLVHFSLRFGQVRIQKQWMRNKFFPLTKLPNLHMSTLYSRACKKWIDSLSKTTHK